MDIIIRELDCLEFNNVDECRHIIESYESNDWKDYLKDIDIEIRPNPCKYKRIIIKSTDKYELVLIAWSVCKSGIHDHAKNGCISKLLKGSITEELYDINLNKIRENKIDVGRITYIDDMCGYHSIIAQDESYSLHVYSPPNHKTKFF
jgi:hypothetical protein